MLPKLTPVSLLELICQKYKLGIPKYEISISGKSHKPIFETKITVGNLNATGVGGSKQLAKHGAAHKLIDIMKDNKDFVKTNENPM